MNILKYILPSLLLIAACASPEPDSTSFEWIEMDRAQELAEKHDKKSLSMCIRIGVSIAKKWIKPSTRIPQ